MKHRHQAEQPQKKTLVSLLDFLMDRELARPEEEQDTAAVEEWNAMADRLTRGAYRPTAAEKRRLYRTMRQAMRQALGQKRSPFPLRKRWTAVPAAVLLTVLVLPIAAKADPDSLSVEGILHRLLPRIRELEEGESITVHEADRDVTFIRGKLRSFRTPGELASFRGKSVLWPSWLPDRVSAGSVDVSPFGSVTLIPLQADFCFGILDYPEPPAFPESLSARIGGAETEVRYVEDERGIVDAAFVFEGDVYHVKIAGREALDAFLAGLTVVPAE